MAREIRFGELETKLSDSGDAIASFIVGDDIHKLQIPKANLTEANTLFDKRYIIKDLHFEFFVPSNKISMSINKLRDVWEYMYEKCVDVNNVEG